jgi:hypothetical protein
MPYKENCPLKPSDKILSDGGTNGQFCHQSMCARASLKQVRNFRTTMRAPTRGGRGFLRKYPPEKLHQISAMSRRL